jgi:hypothetical protein
MNKLSWRYIGFIQCLSLRTAIAIFGAITFMMLSYQHAIAQQSADLPVEQTRKNIKVLQGVRESQLFLVMNFVGDSLGVHCDHCHVKTGKNPQTNEDIWQWESDVKPPKLVARDMMKMMIDLNRTKFKDGAVTCYTCHRGSLSTDRMVPLPPKDFVREKTETSSRILPEAQAIISKYLSVVGGKQVGSSAIVMQGTMERLIDGTSTPIEIIFKQPNKFLIKTTTPQDVITQGTNDVAGWTRSSRGVRIISGESLQRSLTWASVFKPIKTPDVLSQAVVTGISKVGDREVYVVKTQHNPTQFTQMFFDVESGLLLRSIIVNETVLGPLNVQWEFSDYKDVNGLKLPSVIRTADVAAFDTIVRRFSVMRVDSNIDDSIFDVPRTTSPQ